MSHPRKLLIVLFLALLVFPGRVTAADSVWPGISRFQILSFTEQCLKLLQFGRYDLLATQYHLPEEVPADKVQSERQQLASTLARLAEGFGSPGGAELSEKSVAVHQVAVQGLSHDYWRDHDRFEPVIYKVDFAREGEGYLAFLVVVYGQRLQLRAVSFALPKDRPGAAERIDAISAAGGS